MELYVRSFENSNQAFIISRAKMIFSGMGIDGRVCDL